MYVCMDEMSVTLKAGSPIEALVKCVWTHLKTSLSNIEQLWNCLK